MVTLICVMEEAWDELTAAVADEITTDHAADPEASPASHRTRVSMTAWT